MTVIEGTSTDHLEFYLSVTTVKSGGGTGSGSGTGSGTGSLEVVQQLTVHPATSYVNVNAG